MSQGADSGAPSRRIADYALIGDCETAALVHRDGTIEWLCWPRFDSEACFAALLGEDHNGCWRLAAEDEEAKTSRRYRGESLILETRIETSEGIATLIDFMPMRGEASDLVRIVTGERGKVRLRSDLRIRFDYGRLKPRWDEEAKGRTVAIAGPHAARLQSDAPLTCSNGDCASQFSVAAGERVGFVLTYFVSHENRPKPVDMAAALEETERFWAEWVGRCTYQGPWREAVIRSLITMKALIYRPSGAIAAAPTSSLPEAFGGNRNWDYRFCWLRDATFTLLALLGTGYEEEAVAWRDWLLRAVGGEPAQLQPVYGMGGEARLPEWEADWLAGFGGAKPVRFGNLAYQQRQLDIYGEVIDALYQADLHGLPASPAAWQMQLRMGEHLEKVWREPDQGFWESRDRPKHFTHSQGMIWAAFDRIIARAEKDKLDAPLERWRKLRATILEDICQNGYDQALGSFKRDFESAELDANLLLLPQIGFLPPDDPRIIGTIKSIGRRLLRGGFILRYDTHASQDGLPPGEAAFLACTLWYADALVMIGCREEAQGLFERILAVRNDVGLLSEEYDPGSGLLAGNFPQALSHLALVNTALNLARIAGPAARRSGSSQPGT